MIKKFGKLSNQRVFEISQDPKRTQEERDNAFKELEQRHLDANKEQKIIDYINNSKTEELNIEKAQLVIDEPQETTENIITTLITKGRIPEEKAFYALPMPVVVKIFGSLKEDNIKIKESLKRLEESMAELSKQKSEESKTQLSELQKEHEDKKRELEDSNKDLEELKQQLEASNKDLEELKQQLNDVKKVPEQNEEDKELISNLTNNNKELTSKLEQLTEEQNTNIQIIEAIAKVLGKESYEISINSIESLLTTFTTPNSNDDSKKLEEFETKVSNLEAVISALDNTNKEKDKTILSLTNDRDSLRNQLAGNKVESDFDNATHPDIKEEKQDSLNEDDFEEELEEQPKPKRKLVKVFLIIILIAFTATAAFFYIPNELKQKIDILTSLSSQNKKEDILATTPDNTPKDTISLEDRKEVEAKSTTVVETKVQTVNNKITDKKIDPFADANITIGDNPTLPKQLGVQKKEQKPEKAEPSSREYLQSIKSQLKVTPDKKIYFNKEIYSKGEKINNFQIAYITSTFILFMDYKKNNKIIKITLGDKK